MEKTTKIKESSLLYRKIDELALTRNEHSKAIGALKAADRLTDTLYWVLGKLLGNRQTPATEWPTEPQVQAQARVR